MTEQKIKVTIGALLHDIGKVIYREGGDRRNHSAGGCDYLKDEAGIADTEILDCVRYHHGAALKNASLAEDSLAYIVYLADNIAAFVDRRAREETDETGFELSAPLQSVFNILNGNKEELYYKPGDLDPTGEINYPSAEKVHFSKEFYAKIRRRITENLRGMAYEEEYLNSLLSVMEANLMYVPSSTSRAELMDISLYDHVKITAAAAGCIYDYLKETGENYREALLAKEQEFYEKKAFLLCSMDVSGIQNFIYTIASKNALKTLRARSFYLEIMMEHMIDMLLESVDLSRANLIYAGGGHCYLLLANTEETKEALSGFQSKLKAWFLEQFQTELFVALGYVECSANALRNVPEGSYGDLYREMGRMLSGEKQHRYSAQDIRKLNSRKEKDYTRECKVCKHIGNVDDEGVCAFCRKIEALSKDVLYGEFFTVLLEGGEQGLPLPGNYVLVTDTEASLKRRMSEDLYYARTYAKNRMYTGKHMATKLWVGDYTTGNTFEEFAKGADGIKRIGILRADADNLGQAFVFGFENESNGSRYVTLSRTATLSRQLSMFFKYFIRSILENGEFSMDGIPGGKKRKATIIYSGGDDVFIAGSWNDVIELSVDLREKFRRYTQGTLSISAGIGVYVATYPIGAIAQETGEMEAESKRLPGKNAVTLLEDGERHELESAEGMVQKISDGTYTWEELDQEVIGEKYQALREFLEHTDERGMAFLYRILELIRGMKDRINFARFVYLLSRLEPSGEGVKKEQYRQFSQKMYRWIQSEDGRGQLKTAINLYAYTNREQRGKNENDQ